MKRCVYRPTFPESNIQLSRVNIVVQASVLVEKITMYIHAGNDVMTAWMGSSPGQWNGSNPWMTFWMQWTVYK